MPKLTTVTVLSERMPTEDWLIVGVFASEDHARVVAADLAAANGPLHETKVEYFNVISPTGK